MARISEKKKIEFIDYCMTHTVEETCKHFNLRENTVRLRIFKWDIPFKRENMETIKIDLEDLRKYAKNHTLPEIAKKFKVKKNTMYKKLKKNKIEYINIRKPKSFNVHKSIIDHAIHKCKTLGYKGVADYIAQHGTYEFKQNIIKQLS